MSSSFLFGKYLSCLFINCLKLSMYDLHENINGKQT